MFINYSLINSHFTVYYWWLLQSNCSGDNCVKTYFKGGNIIKKGLRRPDLGETCRQKHKNWNMTEENPFPFQADQTPLKDPQKLFQ